MTYHIEIRDDYNDGSLSVEMHQAIRKAAHVTLVQEEAEPDSALTIILTDNDTIQAMNQQYRAVNAPTDVLSFPADPLPPQLAAAADTVYQGDVMIALPCATTQAEKYGHTLQDSLMLLVVHGTLHLLGYDHDSDTTRASMWDAQTEALETLGIDTAIVPALEDSEH